MSGPQNKKADGVVRVYFTNNSPDNMREKTNLV